MKKKRNKPYKPRADAAHDAIAKEQFFARPIKLLRDIRHGEVWTINGETMSVLEDDSHPLPAPDTLRYFAGFILSIGEARGLALDATPVLRLATRLDTDMPVDDGALRSVEEIFELARRLAARIPHNRMVEILHRQEAA